MQNWRNDLAVVAGKRTVVRAFVEVPPGAEPDRRGGLLFGTRNGAPLPGSPLVALNPNGSVPVSPDVVARRGQLADSFNFLLPSSWVDGTVTLRFEPGGGHVVCRDAARPSARDCSATVAFAPAPVPAIKFVGIPYRQGGTTIRPTVAQLFEQRHRALSLLPAASLDFDYGDLYGTFRSQPDLDDVNRRLERQRLMDGCNAASGCTTLYCGVLLGDGGGLAAGIPGTVSSGYNRGVDERTDTFVVPVPLPAEPYATVELLRRRRDRRDRRSPNPPSVTPTAPAAGSVHSGYVVHFAWQAADADGDALAFTVRYSADAGSTWETLAVDLDDTSLDVPRSELRGSPSTRCSRSSPATARSRPRPPRQRSG